MTNFCITFSFILFLSFSLFFTLSFSHVYLVVLFFFSFLFFCFVFAQVMRNKKQTLSSSTIIWDLGFLDEKKEESEKLVPISVIDFSLSIDVVWYKTKPNKANAKDKKKQKQFYTDDAAAAVVIFLFLWPFHSFIHSSAQRCHFRCNTFAIHTTNRMFCFIGSFRNNLLALIKMESTLIFLFNYFELFSAMQPEK